MARCRWLAGVEKESEGYRWASTEITGSLPYWNLPVLWYAGEAGSEKIVISITYVSKSWSESSSANMCFLMPPHPS